VYKLVQVTATLVTLAVVTELVAPLVTVQFWPAGCVSTWIE